MKVRPIILLDYFGLSGCKFFRSEERRVGERV